MNCKCGNEIQAPIMGYIKGKPVCAVCAIYEHVEDEPNKQLTEGNIMGTKMKSWKTTLGGIIAGLAILLTQANNIMDEDPATVLDFAQIAVGFGMLGLGWFSRDNNVSSKQVGADKE